MALQLTYYYRLPKPTILQEAVFDHLRFVLRHFAASGDCSKFYIGITNDLERRRKEHEGNPNRAEFTLMCAIHSEEGSHLDDSFLNLEKQAIDTFRQGVVVPKTNQRLVCANGPGGSSAKNWLYVLVDKQDISKIPLHRTAPVWEGS